MKRLLSLLTALFLLPLCAQAANLDSGLYDPLPPEGSAFVRFLNAAEESGSHQAGANEKSYDYLNYREISPYYAVKQGAIQAGFEDETTDFSAVSGKFYTVVWTKNGVTMIEDPVNNNSAKAQISFYNLSNKESLSLKTKEGKDEHGAKIEPVEVVGATTPGASGARQINPVKVDLAIYDAEGNKVKDAEPLSLERGISYTAILFADQGEILWVRSTTNTTR